MTPESTWPDWYLEPETDESVRGSMCELARYTHRIQTVRQGFGLGATGLQPDVSRREQAVALANQVIARRVRYTVEPFNPGRGRGQIIRTTQELLDGAGTCVDFAVTMAALLNREDIPPVLAVAIPADGSPAHAFVLVGDHPAGARSAPYAEWHARLSPEDSPWLLLDLTPKADDPTGGLPARRAATLKMLQRNGKVHTVDVRSAALEGPGFHLPPPAHRDLGVTAFLPDPAAAFVEFPSHAGVRASLTAAAGRVLLVGPSGAGKSTLALELAGQVYDRRGWFLNGSDDDTLRLELAAAEVQSRGEERGSTDKDNAKTGAARALQRLARSDRPWVVVVDNANDLTDGVLALLPVPRPATDGRRADLLVVTSTDETRAAELVARGWTVERLTPLGDADAEEVGAVWSLLGAQERLPGLARIATWCRDELDDEPTTDSGPGRIVRAALRKAGVDAGTADMVRAVGAAAFMPAEQITRGWVTRAAFADDGAAAAALGVAERAGLVERSRTDGPIGEHTPLWMHRLVRTAVQEQVDPEIGFRTLAGRRDEEYGRDEISELDRFVTRNGTTSSRYGLLAATTVVDLWEGRGLDAVDSAAALGASFVDRVGELVGLATREGASAYVRGQLAVARRASHGNPDDAELVDGIARCVAAAEVCDPLVDRWPAALLLRGRVDAMHGILLRGRAKRIPSGVDDQEKLRLSRAAIEILRQSYDERRAALSEPDGTPGPDPDHHVDRAWYNLGGAYVNVANLLHEMDPSDAGEAAIARELDEAMTAYAGSLSLRRGEPTNYTAASLWGVALAAYSAALYCPGRLDLTGVAETEELAGVLARQDRSSLLLAAEHCASTALRIWTELSGSPNNARKLLLKIGLAWTAKDSDAVARARQFRAALQDAMKDLEIATVAEVRIIEPDGEAT